VTVNWGGGGFILVEETEMILKVSAAVLPAFPKAKYCHVKLCQLVDDRILAKVWGRVLRPANRSPGCLEALHVVTVIFSFRT